MNFFSKPSTTNILLAVIALLLTAQVIGQATKAPSPSMNPHGTEMASRVHETGDPHEGHNHAMSEPTGEAPEMDPAAMVLAALNCPDDRTMTLDSPACRGAEADKRRSAVKQIAAKSETIRGIFDQVVSKFGEDSLTAQAIEIRKSMRAKRMGK